MGPKTKKTMKLLRRNGLGNSLCKKHKVLPKLCGPIRRQWPLFL